MAVSAIISPFLWGEGGQKLTPEELARQRKVADALFGRKNPAFQNAGWLGVLGQGLEGAIEGWEDSRLDRAEEKTRGETDRLREGANSAVYEALMGPSASAATSGVAQELAASSPAPAVSPVDISGSRAEFVSSLLPAAMEESKRTGIDPRIIVAQAAQETGWGKSAPGNNYFGIKSHGQDGGQTLATNEVINGKTVRIRDSFRQFESPADSVRGYGDFILQNPRYRDLRSAQGMDAQLEALQASGYATDPNYSRSVGAIARGIQIPNEVASLDLTAGMTTSAGAIDAIAPPSGAVAPEQPVFDAGRFSDPINLAEMPAGAGDLGQRLGAQASSFAPTLPPATTVAPAPPVASMPVSAASPPPSVAQALMSPTQVAQAQPQRSAPAIHPAIIDALSSPYADEGTKRIAGLLLGQHMEQQQQANDPVRQMQLEKGRLELEAMRNPTPEFRQISGQAAAAMGLDPSKAYNVERNGKITTIGGDGVTVNNNMGGDKFGEEFAKLDAKALADVSTSGVAAQRNIGRINQLDELLKSVPTGAEANFKQIAGNYGISLGADTGNIQAAQALINSLVPEQRQPGSGPMSDADLDLFKQSLPRLINQPGGNSAIINTMRAIAQYDAEGASIVQRTRLPADQGGITRAQAFDMLQNRANPLAEFKAPEQPATSVPQPGQVIDGYRFRGGNPADQSSWEKVQ